MHIKYIMSLLCSIHCNFFVQPKTGLPLIFVAKAKLLKWRIHETGGGPVPAKFNRIEEAVIRLLGSTPEFAGIVSDYFGDSRIEMKKGPNNNDLQAKVCKANKVGQTSTLVRAMNTSK